MDKYRIDDHKLIYHIPRVHEWLKGNLIYPIYIEISPAGACNHRCDYCGLDFMGYQPRYPEVNTLKERLAELSKLRVKSIMYAGEGEPLLHKEIAEIISYTKEIGIDVSITTNGVLLKKELADDILANIEWIKVSIDAATRDTHAKIHHCPLDDFDRIIENMSYAAKLKKDNNLTCTLGMQLLLLPENKHEAVTLAKLARDIGMDYLVIKPYSQHPQSKTTRYSSVVYNDYDYLAAELMKFDTDDFNIIFRIHTMEKWNRKTHSYKSCYALPFWSYIDAGGNVWGCSVYIGDERFLYGNIYKQHFKEIWEGKKRLESVRWSEEVLDISQCRINCRMDEANSYLWDLKNPPVHVNFI